MGSFSSKRIDHSCSFNEESFFLESLACGEVWYFRIIKVVTDEMCMILQEICVVTKNHATKKGKKRFTTFTKTFPCRQKTYCNI